MPITFEQIAYKGWPTCYRLSNGRIELVITADVGPRIIRFGFVDGPNQFAEIPADAGQIGGDAWRMYGGHRFWVAPEHPALTYHPDNAPVKVSERKGLVMVTQPSEPPRKLQKMLRIRMDEDADRVTVTHRLNNRGTWRVKGAPWALSVMAPGGVGVFPLPERSTHGENLLPTSSLVLWAYTRMDDPRWTWGERYILLRQEPGNTSPQKVGAAVPDGWAAYVNEGTAFIKQFAYDPNATYADMGCNYETFTNEFMLELESLGPLVDLGPGDTVDHVETWSLHADVPTVQAAAEIAENAAPI